MNCMRRVANIAQIATLAVVIMICATLWASNRARERAACYRQAHSIEECSQPNALERALRWVFS